MACSQATQYKLMFGKTQRQVNIKIAVWTFYICNQLAVTFTNSNQAKQNSGLHSDGSWFGPDLGMLRLSYRSQSAYWPWRCMSYTLYIKQSSNLQLIYCCCWFRHFADPQNLFPNVNSQVKRKIKRNIPGCIQKFSD
jgi:hypothetical protein